MYNTHLYKDPEELIIKRISRRLERYLNDCEKSLVAASKQPSSVSRITRAFSQSPKDSLAEQPNATKEQPKSIFFKKDDDIIAELFHSPEAKLNINKEPPPIHLENPQKKEINFASNEGEQNTAIPVGLEQKLEVTPPPPPQPEQPQLHEITPLPPPQSEQPQMHVITPPPPPQSEQPQLHEITPPPPPQPEQPQMHEVTPPPPPNQPFSEKFKLGGTEETVTQTAKHTILPKHVVPPPPPSILSRENSPVEKGATESAKQETEKTELPKPQIKTIEEEIAKLTELQDVKLSQNIPNKKPAPPPGQNTSVKKDLNTAKMSAKNAQKQRLETEFFSPESQPDSQVDRLFIAQVSAKSGSANLVRLYIFIALVVIFTSALVTYLFINDF